MGERIIIFNSRPAYVPPDHVYGLDLVEQEFHCTDWADNISAWGSYQLSEEWDEDREQFVYPISADSDPAMMYLWIAAAW